MRFPQGFIRHVPIHKCDRGIQIFPYQPLFLMKNISKTYTKLGSAHTYLLDAGALILGISLLIPNPPLKLPFSLGNLSPRLQSRPVSRLSSVKVSSVKDGIQPGFRSSTLFSLLASAFEDGNEKTFFERSPRLIRSATSFRSPWIRANYYFTIEVPSDAGKPLKAVTIIQQTNLEQIVFFPSQTRAFFGDSFDSDDSIPLASVNRETSEKNGLKVVFEQPVEPGLTVTISLRVRNPRYGGIYQFGVTAFPVGAQSQGLYLGIGRIHLSQPGGRG